MVADVTFSQRSPGLLGFVEAYGVRELIDTESLPE
jgi:hypothetical protein